jgi:hypothetical protein
MKRILAVTLIATMFTGCAQLENNLRRNLMDSVDVAKEDCGKMGFIPGTQQYQNCVLVNTQNIRNNRAIQAAASAASAQAAANAAESARLNQPVQQINQGYRNYDCRSRLGGRVECTGY